MFKLKLGAVALAFALSTALPVEIPYTAGLVGATAAQAGIFGKIKGAVKTVGSEAKKFATDTAKHAKTSAKIVGGKAKSAAKTVGRNAAQWGKHSLTGARDIGKATGGAIGAGVIAIQRPLTGWDGFKFSPPGVGRGPDLTRPLPKPPAGGPGSWGGKTAKSAMAGKQGLVARDKSAMGRPVGVKAPNQGIGKPNLGLGRDKSAWGRPVGISKRHMGRTSMRNVQRTPMRNMMRRGRR